MEELHFYLKKHSCEYKKMLFVIDRYSRYKTQLKESMEIKRDYDVMNGNNDENIEDVGEMEYLDMEMREYENEENFAVFEECFHNFHSIAYRRNVLANMEMLILRMLIEDGSLTNIEFSIYSKLKILLIDYHQRVKKFLKRNKALVEFKDNSQRKQLIKCFKKKYNQLKQLLLKMTKKEIFFTESMVLPSMVQNNGENKNN